MREIILITRPRAQGLDFEKDLQKLGFKTLVEPLLEIKRAEVSGTVNLSTYQAILLTSIHALQALKEHVKAQERPAYVVGSTTGKASEGAGFYPVIVCDSAASLFQQVTKDLKPEHGPVLYVRGHDISTPLKESLEAQSFRCEELTVYAALASDALPPAALKLFQEGAIHAVTFFSARTARIFCELAHKYALPLSSTIALCFSDSVLECVRFLDWKETYTCTSPTRRAMTELIVRTGRLSTERKTDDER